MQEYEKNLDEAVRISRLTQTLERPMIWGKHMETTEYQGLLKFCFTLGQSMDEIQNKRKMAMSKDELAKMCLSAAKWSLEEYTTRKPANRKEI